MMRTADDFAGNWVLNRRLVDRLGVMDGTVSGQAVLTRDGQRLRYHEQGRLTLATGGVMQASRTYLWQCDPAGIDVFFEDGSPFHRFSPVGKSTGTAHLCGADLYTCDYDFTGWPCWRAVWTVAGPRKDYTSTSVYTPCPQS